MKSTRWFCPFQYLAIFLIAVICSSLIHYQSASAAIAIDLYVDTPVDSQTNNTGCTTVLDDNHCSLRGAIQYIRDTGGTSPYLINVPADTYNLTIPGSDDTNAQGDLDISGPNITIDGAGMSDTIINGNGNFDRIIDYQGEADLVLSDLTIQHGNLSSGQSGGGGVRALSTGKLTLDNVHITSNYVGGIQTADSGGGISVTDADLSIIGGTQIDDNSACHGGGIIVLNSSAKLVDIDSSVISGNTARCELGGGILIASFATVTIDLTTISSNHALRGGGYAQSSNTSSTLTGLTITGNIIDTGGTGAAGMEIYGTATISGSTVSSNSAPTGIGGIRLKSTSIFNMTDSAIISNDGYAAGGLLVEDNVSALLQRIEITSNTSTNGGGISVTNYGNIDLENVTIADNDAGHYGGGLYLQSNDSADLDHVTIANNTGILHGDAVYIGDNGNWSSKNSIFYYFADGDVCYYAGLFTRSSGGHNIISDNSCGLTAGTDLPDTDPLLGELDFYESKFQSIPPLYGSPAIDGAITSDPVTTDQRGMPRVDGDGDLVVTSDIGAHESAASKMLFLPMVINP
ncbi:MAG: right-handed parallel beta-helix repeat-containing protein [Anaerolineaceae bacterium]